MNRLVRILGPNNRGFLFADKLLLCHFTYVFIWVILGSVAPAVAEIFVLATYPITRLTIYVYPALHGLYMGPLSPMFYDSVASEGLFAAFLICVVLAVLWGARYYNRPWRFAEYMAERSNWLLVLLSIAIFGAAMIPMSFMATYFFGFPIPLGHISSPPGDKTQSLPQIAMCVSVLGFGGWMVILVYLEAVFSLMAYIVRRLIHAVTATQQS